VHLRPRRTVRPARGGYLYGLVRESQRQNTRAQITMARTTNATTRISQPVASADISNIMSGMLAASIKHQSPGHEFGSQFQPILKLGDQPRVEQSILTIARSWRELADQRERMLKDWSDSQRPRTKPN